MRFADGITATPEVPVVDQRGIWGSRHGIIGPDDPTISYRNNIYEFIDAVIKEFMASIDPHHYRNRYVYCSNNPINRIDPLGLFDDELENPEPEPVPVPEPTPPPETGSQPPPATTPGPSSPPPATTPGPGPGSAATPAPAPAPTDGSSNTTSSPGKSTEQKSQESNWLKEGALYDMESTKHGVTNEVRVLGVNSETNVKGGTTGDSNKAVISVGGNFKELEFSTITSRSKGSVYISKTEVKLELGGTSQGVGGVGKIGFEVVGGESKIVIYRGERYDVSIKSNAGIGISAEGAAMVGKGGAKVGLGIKAPYGAAAYVIVEPR